MRKKLTNLFVMIVGCLLIGLPAMAQTHIVSGTVKGTDGQPVISAGVVISGTTDGAMTGVDGTYSVAAKPSDVLEFSCLGYKSVSVPVGSQSIIDVILEEDNNLLDELVVVGYAVQKKVNLTGSVAAISSKEIENIPVANTTTLLQGRLPGLVITSNGAQAGNDNPELRIRGIGTFGNNDPTIFIDGVEGTLAQLSEIPSAEIENVSVLKDAASSAIYGVRAANGVILITTKKGEAGKVKVSFNNSLTYQTPGIVPDYVGGYDWALMRNEASPGTYSDDALRKLKDGSDPDRYANTDWLSLLLRNAWMHQHYLSVSGGNDRTKFMTSISYSDQDGIMKYTGVEKISFRSNVESRLNKFTFGLNLSGNKNNVEAPAIAPSGSSGIMRYVSWFTHPTVPAIMSNGHYGYADGSWTDVESSKNPLELMALGNRSNETWRFNGRAYAGLDIIDGLHFQTSLAYNFSINATRTYKPKDPARYNADGEVRKMAGANNSQNDYWYRNATITNENLLTYNKAFGKHSLNALLGHSIIISNYFNSSASNQGYPTETIFVLSGGTKNPSVSGKNEEYRLQSFFARLGYSYADKYLFEFNIRRDGSSRLPSSHRYDTFPSVSAGWVFSKEEFMKNVPILSFGKLRASWGKLGNQEIGNYAYTATLGAKGNYYFNQSGDKQAGMVQTSIPNDEIMWETTQTLDLGFDLGFFENKVQATFDWYNKTTNDILMQLSMPGIFLGSLWAPYQNAGAVQNRGWELSLNYNDGAGDWKWSAGFNVGHVNNKILEMGGLTENISGHTINRVGEPIGSYYGYNALGLYRTESDLNRTTADGVVIKQNGQVPKLGDIMYEDVNGDGDITPDDRVIIGNPFPSFSYGFNLGASWKNFDLVTFWQGVSGIYRYNWETTTGVCGNMTSRWLDRYSAENVNGSMPAFGNAINDNYSSFWLDKSDYLRLKNLEFGYTFRQKELGKAGISNIRVYFAGTNLLTFTSLKNWDPEKSSGDERNDVHPNVKTYSFGVNFNF